MHTHDVNFLEMMVYLSTKSNHPQIKIYARRTMTVLCKFSSIK